MMTRNLPVLGVIAAGALIVLSQTFFIVDQRKQAVVVRLGEPVRVINAPGDVSPGLKIKAPFVENVVQFDKRNLAIEAAQEEITAADQQRLVVDAFVRYRISDPLQYYRTLRDEQIASDRIERLANSSLRQVLGTATSNDIISGRREALLAQTKKDVAARADSSRLGIQIIDVRIKRADYPAQIQESVYRRMQTSRQQEAARIRAHGAPAGVQAGQAQAGVGLVDRAVGLDPQVGLGDLLARGQARGALVAGPGVDPVQGDHVSRRTWRATRPPEPGWRRRSPAAPRAGA